MDFRRDGVRFEWMTQLPLPVRCYGFGADSSVEAHQGKVEVDQPWAEEDPYRAGGADVGAVGNLEIAPELRLRERDERKPGNRAEDGRDDEREDDRNRTEQRAYRAHQEHVAHPHRLALERLGADEAHKPEKPEAEDEPGQRPGDRHQPCGDAVHAVESTGTVPRRPCNRKLPEISVFRVVCPRRFPPFRCEKSMYGCC